MEKGKKAFEVTKQVLRWIWKIILSILFVAGVVFQAPLKVLAFIIIFLLASFALPLRFRKWFWSGVGVVVAALIVWVVLPENDKEWKPYTFDEELAVLEANYKVPDEENAAIIYDQLIVDYNKSELENLSCEIDEIIGSEYWHSKDYPQVASLLNNHKALFEKLREASALEKCKFQITSKNLIILEVNKSSFLRKWAVLLSKAGNNDIAEGRTGEGIEKIYCIYQIGDHLCRQPLLINILSGIAIKFIAMGRFDKLAVTQDLDENQLNEIEEFIKNIKYDWQTDLPKVLGYEKLFMKNVLGSMIYETNSKGKIRLNRNPQKAARYLMPAESNELPKQPYFAKKLLKAYTILGWFFVPSSPQKLSQIIDFENEKFYKMAEPDYDWSTKSNEVKFSFWDFKLNYKYFIKLLSLILAPSYHSVHDLYLRSDSGQRGALLLIGLKRYENKNRCWPENLDDIKGFAKEESFIDPTNGQSFVYEHIDGDFVLYSKGRNGIDDGGIGYSGDEAKEDDVYIWPSKKDRKKISKDRMGEPNDIKGEQK